MTNYKEIEHIIERMIESIIMPEYPEISMFIVDSEFFRGVRKYYVAIFGNIDEVVQTRIAEKIKNLFMMASLNIQSPAGLRDFVDVHFS